jgi:hypothetical protein
MPLEQIIENIMAEYGGPMSAEAITVALSARGALPPYWTVIDVADFLKQWFSESTCFSGSTG